MSILFTAPPAACAEAAQADAEPVSRAELAPLLPFTGEVATVWSAERTAQGSYSLGDRLIVCLQPGGDSALRARGKTKNMAIALILDGYPLQGLAARQDPADPECIHFELRYTEADKDAWSSLFHKRQRLQGGVVVTVGFADGEMAHSKVELRLLILPPWQRGLAGLLAMALLGLVVYLGARTTMLRSPPAAAAPAGALGPYSLGLVQMAWWTLVVMWAFLFLYLATDAVQLNSSVVGLMGIGAGTALGAILIDDSKQPPQSNAPAQTAVAEPDLTSKAQPAKPPAWAPSKGLLRDVLTDGTGISLHRLQLFAWTAILSGVFIHRVLTSLTMTEFDSTLLALMGISGGTYLGFKFPEKQGLS